MEKINESLSIRNGRLFIEDCDATDLAREFGTPLYVISENHLRANTRHYQQAFSNCWPEGNVRVVAAFKAFPSLALRRILSDEGTGCDCFGPGELEGAIRGNTPPELISVNGSIKDRDIIKRAITIGARIVLDAAPELDLCQAVAAELGKTARVMLRPKPYMADLHTRSDFSPELEIRYLTQRVKYGIPGSDVIVMGERATLMHNIEVVGIHIHMGRHSKKLEVWEAWIKACVDIIQRLHLAMGGWLPKIIDVGGGFPSAHDRDSDVAVTDYPTPALEEFANTITSALRSSMAHSDLDPRGITLEMEPGRGIYGDAGIHLTAVHNIKRELENAPRVWAETDTAETFLGVTGSPLGDHALFDNIVTNKAGEATTETADIVGQTCNFELLSPDARVPPLDTGDVIALLNTGAYNEPMAANFNSLPRPASVLVCGDTADIIKQRETVDDVFARDRIPARFE